MVTFKWLLTGAYGLPHTFNALTQYISYFNSLSYNGFFFFFFFSSPNFRRGGALAPCIDAPPLDTSLNVYYLIKTHIKMSSLLQSTDSLSFSTEILYQSYPHLA